MKKFSGIFTVYALLIFLSVNAQKDFKKNFVEEFKYRYFESCLKNGFNNSTEIKKLIDIDKGGYSELILGDGYFKIDSLSKITALKIKQDSLNSIGKRAEGAAGKRVFSTCLCNYNSTWLTEIAKREFKKNQRLRSKDK